MFKHDDYDAKKNYLFTNASKNVSLLKTRLVQETATHMVNALVKQNWGLNLTSVETVKCVGATLAQTADGTQKIEKLYLRQFVIVYSDVRRDNEVKWRK